MRAQRLRPPKYKAKVEAGVLIAKRWILAVLRHHVFHSLAELNAAIRGLLERLNDRKLRKLKISRRELFMAQDRPSAKALPERPYEFAEWKKVRLGFNYHVEVDRHNYSVPYRLLREELHVRLTAGVVEIFRKGDRVAAHARASIAHGYTTLPEHMPLEHRQFAERTPERMIEWAAKTGPATAMTIEKIMSGRDHPEQGY